jgi:hypothetical protein
MENLPVYINVGFVLITLLTIWLFYKATNYSKLVWIIITAWLIIQTIISLTGFYTITKTHPPRFLLLVLPALLFIILLFTTNKGRMFIDNMDVKMLTLLHAIRIPVELILFGLFINKTIPEAMTFEGRNFDILSGLTAPFIYYFGFVKKTLDKKIILAWNFICLALLINIVATAILSAPFTFQKLAFDQPNIAILYFPFVWLPCCIVPIVFLSHLASIRQLHKRLEKAHNYNAPARALS